MASLCQPSTLAKHSRKIVNLASQYQKLQIRNWSHVLLFASPLQASCIAVQGRVSVPVPSPQVPSFVSALTERMACRVLVFFVRHASLVRPLSNDGKLRLAKVSSCLSACVSVGLPAIADGKLGLANDRAPACASASEIAFALALVSHSVHVHLSKR